MPPSKLAALDQTSRVVRAGARVAEFVLRKDRVVDHIARLFGDRIVDKVLDDLEEAIEEKLIKKTRVPKEESPC